MSDETRAGPLNKEEGQTYKIQCPECERKTNHTVLKSVEYVSHLDDRGFSITAWEEHQIVECLGCQTVSFRRRFRDTENTYHDDEGHEELDERIELFPNRLAGRSTIDESWMLPGDVRLIYEESLSALRGGMRVLSGIGLRALVETVCKEREASGRNLEERIEALVTQGVLTKDGAEILHGLRIMGNLAAHEVRPHTVADLNTAFDVIEHVLLGVYILPKKAERLPRRSLTDNL